MVRTFGVGCMVFGMVSLVGCAGSPTNPDPAETQAAASEPASKVSPYVGTWQIDRTSTWLTVWTMAYGEAEKVNIPDDQYKAMSEKIDEVVDSMKVEVVLAEDGTMLIDSAMGAQHEKSTGTWTRQEDGSIEVLAQSDTNSEKSGETAAVGTIEGGKLVLVMPEDNSGFGTIKFNRVSK